MKFLKPFLVLSIFATGILLTTTGCDDENPEPTPGNVEFQFNYKVNGEDFTAGNVYTINGTAVSFSQANFYVGGIEMNPEQGDPVMVEGKHLLVTPSRQQHEVTELDAGQYTNMKFFLGVGLEENNQSELDFTNRSSDDPLAAQDPSMAWPWGAGYKFVRVDGMVDTDGDGTPDSSMQFHLGDPDPTDNDPKFRRDLEFTFQQNIESGDNTIEFDIDLAQLFNDIDLSTQYITHVGDNIDLANAFFANLDRAFTVK